MNIPRRTYKPAEARAGSLRERFPLAHKTERAEAHRFLVHTDCRKVQLLICTP